MELQRVPPTTLPTGKVCVNKDFFSSTNKLRNKLEKLSTPIARLERVWVDPVPAGPKRVHGFLKSQSTVISDCRQRKSRDLLAGLVLRLPQASRLSLGLFQTLVLAGRGGVWQVSAWRSRAAAGPLRGGVGQVGIHQLQDLFHLREGGGQRATGGQRVRQGPRGCLFSFPFLFWSSRAPASPTR